MRSIITLVGSGLLLLYGDVPPSPMHAASRGPQPALHASAVSQSPGPAIAQRDDAAGRRQDRAGEPDDPSVLTDPRVRPADSVARRLIADGTRRSFTIASLIDTVERGDVIVYVHVTAPPGGLLTSQTRLLGPGTNGWRYASVWIDQRLLPLRRLEMLGHELQHVVEIGEARDATDAESLQHLYQKIGYESLDDHAFETKNALVAQLRVSQELLAGSALTDDGRPDDTAPPDASALRGRALYDAYCAVCHGRNGRGRGLAFQALSMIPPDLTLLAEHNGGAFPRSEIERCIRASVRSPSAAGSNQMPIWSALVAMDGDAGAAEHAQDIVAHVEFLQRRHP